MEEIKQKFDELIKYGEHNNILKIKLNNFLDQIYLNEDEKNIVKLLENDDIEKIAMDIINNDMYFSFDVNKILVYIKHDFLYFLKYYDNYLYSTESKNQKIRCLERAEDYLNELNNKYNFIFYFKGIVYEELSSLCNPHNKNDKTMNPCYETAHKNFKLFKSYNKIANYYYFYQKFDKFKYYLKKYLANTEICKLKLINYHNFLKIISKNKKNYYIKKYGYWDDSDKYYYFTLKNKYTNKSINNVVFIYYLS